ncbi:MAG: thioesterase family protein [Bdellovibrionota bacterium]
MFEIPFQIDYVDTDAMGIMHHSRYCRYLERARVRWLETMGLRYADLERDGYTLPLSALSLEYRKPLRFDDRGFVRLAIEELGRARLKIVYELVDETGTIVTTARTEHVLLKNMKPVRIPDEWREKWQQQREQTSSTSR